MKSPRPPRLTQSALQRAGRFWQRQLRLEDWDVKLVSCRLHELGEGTLGDIDFGSGNKCQVKIRVLNHRDIDGQGFWFNGECWDWEVTLVHELLHIPMKEAAPKTHTSQAAERFIHRQSRLLVRLAKARA